ncbi:unnamed protein product [Amaranthus hypochondriacus]
MGKYVEYFVVVITLSIMMVMGCSAIKMDDHIGSILIRGIQKDRSDDGANDIQCIPNGVVCISQACCPGNICKLLPTFGAGYCGWCPPAGYPCGALDDCCLGLTCDGYFSGTCR